MTGTPLNLEGGAGILRADWWRPMTSSLGVVVMLHGGGQTRHSWDRSARALAAEGWQVFTVDARGHGRSDWSSAGDYGVDAFVDDLCLAVDHIERLCPTDGRPVLIGASLGGITALLAEGERGPLARALVLVDIAPRMEPAGVERIGAFMGSGSEGFASLDEVADAVAAYQPHRDRPADIGGLRRNVRRGDDDRWYWHWDPQFLSAASEMGDPGSLHRRLLTAARRVPVPTLLVRGVLSDVVSVDGVDELLAAMPDAGSVDVRGAAHMVAGDDNSVFIRETGGFLRSISTGVRAPRTAFPPQKP